MSESIESLKKQLGEYGLNPEQWKVTRINSKNYLVKNKQERELCIWGMAEKKRWKQLRLVEF